MPKMMFLGDTHCDIPSTVRAIRKASKNDVRTIMQLGDFGYWPHDDEGQRFLEVVSDVSTQEGISFSWLDGNHENHYRLSQEPFSNINPNVYYMARGSWYQRNGVNFFIMGGAGSSDAHLRLEEDPPGSSWWSNEIISEFDLKRAKDNLMVAESVLGDIDVVLCHDMPSSSPLSREYYGPTWVKDRALLSRSRLDEIIRLANPKLVVHGHMHTEYFEPAYPPYHDYNIMGLGAHFTSSDRRYAIVDIQKGSAVIQHQFRGLAIGRDLLRTSK